MPCPFCGSSLYAKVGDPCPSCQTVRPTKKGTPSISKPRIRSATAVGVGSSKTGFNPPGKGRDQ